MMWYFVSAGTFRLSSTPANESAYESVEKKSVNGRPAQVYSAVVLHYVPVFEPEVPSRHAVPCLAANRRYGIYLYYY